MLAWDQRYDAIILGAGAAGLMCAIVAGRRGRHVLVLERAERIGKTFPPPVLRPGLLVQRILQRFNWLRNRLGSIQADSFTVSGRSADGAKRAHFCLCSVGFPDIGETPGMLRTGSLLKPLSTQNEICELCRSRYYWDWSHYLDTTPFPWDAI